MYYKRIEGVDEQGNPTHYFLEMPTVDVAMKILKIIDKKHPDIHLLTKLFYVFEDEDDKSNLEYYNHAVGDGYRKLSLREYKMFKDRYFYKKGERK